MEARDAFLLHGCPPVSDLVGGRTGVAVGGVRTLDLDLSLAKLERRVRGMWMKTGYLGDVGARPDVGNGCLWRRRPTLWVPIRWDSGTGAGRTSVGKPYADTEVRDRRPRALETIARDGGFWIRSRRPRSGDGGGRCSHMIEQRQAPARPHRRGAVRPGSHAGYGGCWG